MNERKYGFWNIEKLDRLVRVETGIEQILLDLEKIYDLIEEMDTRIDSIEGQVL